MLGYLGGLALVGQAFVATARAKPPASYPTWSVLAAAVWLAASLTALVVAIASAPSWAVVGTRLDALAVPLAAGFGAQVLLGALSYLIPVVLGGGPAAVRAANAELERAGRCGSRSSTVGCSSACCRYRASCECCAPSSS